MCAQRDSWLDQANNGFAQKECSFAEQQIAGHIQSILKSLLRTFAQICCMPAGSKFAPVSEATFNRVHSKFNDKFHGIRSSESYHGKIAL